MDTTPPSPGDTPALSADLARLRNELLLRRVADAMPNDFPRRFGLEYPAIVAVLPTAVPPPEPPRRSAEDNPFGHLFTAALSDALSGRASDAPSGDVFDGASENLLQRLGLDLPPIVGVLPSEDLPPLDVKTDDALLFRLADDTLLHVGFKVRPDVNALLDAMTIGVSAFIHYHQPINTVVLCGAAVDDSPDTLDTGSLTIQATNVMLGREDGAAALERLRRAARQREPVTSADRVDIILLPLLRHDRPLRALLPEVVAAALALPDAERATVVGGLAALAIRYADAEFARALLEELHMTETLDALIDDGIRRGHERGKAEGLAEGKRAALRTVLYARFGVVPPALERRIAGADPEALDALLVRAARAEHIELL